MKELTTRELADHWRVKPKRISARAHKRGIHPTRLKGRTAYWPARAKAFLGPISAGMAGQTATERIREAWASGRNRP